MATKIQRQSLLVYNEDYSHSEEEVLFERDNEHIKYTREIGERFLIDNGFENILNRLLCLKHTSRTISLYNKIIEGLFAVGLQNGVDELKMTLSSACFPTENGGLIRVPNSINQFLDMDVNGVGKGEIALILLCADNIIHNPGKRYDVCINGSFWHIKDHREEEGCRMGKPIGSKNDNHWLSAPIFQFIFSLKKSLGFGKGLNFGTKFFEHKSVRSELLKRYDTTDIVLAFEKIQNEFDDAIHSSAEFGDAVGVIELVYDTDGNACFKRINKKDVHFYSITQDALKITSRPDRYVNACKRFLKKEEKNENRSRRRKHETRS